MTAPRTTRPAPINRQAGAIMMLCIVLALVAGALSYVYATEYRETMAAAVFAAACFALAAVAVRQMTRLRAPRSRR